MFNYHLSDIYLGNQTFLTPRIPRDPMLDEGILTPRISSSKEIGLCLFALRNVFYNKGIFYVYYTYDNPINPLEFIPDKYLTNEKWFLQKTLFYYAGILEKNLFNTFKISKILSFN